MVRTDLERARSGRAIDARRARGETLGPLAGLPMTIKDSLDVEHMPASSGLEALQQRPAADAAVVARARAAGAVIWGKTNVPVMTADWQSFNALYGTTNNPWNLDLHLAARPGALGGHAGGERDGAGDRLSTIGGPAAGCRRQLLRRLFPLKPDLGLVPQTRPCAAAARQ